jgi:hypothetical protein
VEITKICIFMVCIYYNKLLDLTVEQ